jgi:hypothetical protein
LKTNEKPKRISRRHRFKAGSTFPVTLCFVLFALPEGLL